MTPEEVTETVDRLLEIESYFDEDNETEAEKVEYAELLLKLWNRWNELRIDMELYLATGQASLTMEEFAPAGLYFAEDGGWRGQAAMLMKMLQEASER